LIFVDGIDKQVKNVIDICKELGTSNPIKHIVFNLLNESQKKTLQQIPCTIKVYTCEEFMELGRKSKLTSKDLVCTKDDADAVAIIM